MTGTACSTHSEVAAEFRCDGCGRLLCPECVESGHRLFVCRRCGERALPLATGASAATHEYARQRRLDRPYGFGDALLYPFRGLGRYLVPVWVLSLFLIGFLGWMATLVAHALVALLLPGLLLEVARTTAAGDDELPDWPDFADSLQRGAELLQVLFVGLVTLLPAWLLARFSGASLLDLLGGRTDLATVAGLLCALFLGLALGVFAFGATGVHGSGWLTFRLDLHLEALLSKAGPPGLATAGIVVGLTALRLLLGALLAPLPLLGSLVSEALGAYALVLSAHFVGLLFRRHRATLDAIYRD